MFEYLWIYVDWFQCILLFICSLVSNFNHFFAALDKADFSRSSISDGRQNPILIQSIFDFCFPARTLPEPARLIVWFTRKARFKYSLLSTGSFGYLDRVETLVGEDRRLFTSGFFLLHETKVVWRWKSQLILPMSFVLAEISLDGHRKRSLARISCGYCSQSVCNFRYCSNLILIKRVIHFWLKKENSHYKNCQKSPSFIKYGVLKYF